MGCDIHTYFETRQPDGTWAPTFPLSPSRWWWERLAEEKIEDGSAITIFGPPSPDEIAAYRAEKEKTTTYYGSKPSDEDVSETILYEKLVAHFKALTPEQVVEQYGHYPSFRWEFFPAEVCRSYGTDYYSPDVTSRNYDWFGALSRQVAGYRGGSPVFSEDDRGVPDDCSPLVAKEIDRWAGDGHSHGWFMVNELVARDDLKRFEHYRWLQTHIADPENTRMVFFFDN